MRPTRRCDPLWLEPYPDILLEAAGDRPPGHAVRYGREESMTLAFLSALHELPPRQRAVLLLRDVLGFAASETADILDTNEPAVTSALTRARATIDARWPPEERKRAPAACSVTECRLVDRFAEAFTTDDIDGVVALLTEDATLTLPPEPVEYRGRETIAAFLRERSSRRAGRGFRLVPVRANSQPAFGCYLRDRHAPVARCHGLIVLTLDGDRISAITRFADSSAFRHFGLPRMLRD
jgi:RNA polymerase sigma-70 factor (TIGR02960 family)